jgi:integrase
MKINLKTATVATLKPSDDGSRAEFWDTNWKGAGSFGLRVTGGGERSWCVLFRRHGRQIRETLGTYPALSLADAREKARRALHESENRAGATKLTVGEYADRWLADLAHSNLKPRTVQNYTYLCRLHIVPAIGRIRLRDLRRSDVKDFLNGKRKQGTLSKNTIRLIRAALSAMLGEALDDELIADNPAAIPSRRRGKKGNETISAAERQKSIRPFSDDELGRVLSWVNKGDAEYYPLFMLLARTGIRPGEAFALKWTDIDFAHRKILVERALSAGKIGPTKTDSVRTVEMSRELGGVLSALHKRRESQTLKEGWGEVPEPVFINGEANLLDESRVRKQFARAMKKAGISGHRLYDLRHTFASALLAKGAPITYVAAQLGHAKPTTTLQHYSRWLPQASVEYVDRLDVDGPLPEIVHINPAAARA